MGSRGGHWRWWLRMVAFFAASVTTFAALVVIGAGASTPAANTMVGIPVGTSAASLPDATDTGATPPATTETVSFVLKEQNIGALEAAVEQGTTSFLTVAQFAQQYGQSSQVISQLQAYLARFGISTQVYPNHVDVVATGTVSAFDQALSVQQHQYYVPQRAGQGTAPSIPAQTVHGTSQTPQLPYSLAQYVVAIMGLTNYGALGTDLQHTPASSVRPVKNSANACLALTGLSNDCNLPSDIASDYDLSPLYQQGNTGSGQTVGILTFASLDPGAPQYFWKNVSHTPTAGRTVSLVNVDGGAGAPSNDAGSSETDLDVEQAGGIAPAANIVVYQAPNDDSGFVDAFFDAAAQNLAGTISMSWVESETYLRSGIASGADSPAFQQATDEALLELAAQGQTTFVGSGDYGAYGPSADLGTTDIGVSSPSDSPFVTSVGGTTLPWSGPLSGPDGTVTVTVPSERTWGSDYFWQALATVNGTSLADTATNPANVAGDGGGFSAIEPTPTYQRGFPGTNSYSALEYLIPSGYQQIDGIVAPTTWTFNPTPRVIRGTGTGRAVPDLSTDADWYSGFYLYAPSFTEAGSPALEGGWGGTSFSGPDLNGAASVIDGYLGHRVGLWNPWLYRFAAQASSPFTPLETSGASNDNLFYTGTAGVPYNEGSGLGVPNLTQLARDLRSAT